MHLPLNGAKATRAQIHSLLWLYFLLPMCLSIIILIPTQAGPRTIRFAQSRNDRPRILQLVTINLCLFVCYITERLWFFFSWINCNAKEAKLSDVTNEEVQIHISSTSQSFMFIYMLYLNSGAPREISGPGAKILYGPFGKWCPKITWWAKKGHSVRRCSNFGPKSRKTSSRPQAVVWADEFCILNLTILNPGPPCVPGPPDSESFCPPSRRASLNLARL